MYGEQPQEREYTVGGGLFSPKAASIFVFVGAGDMDGGMKQKREEKEEAEAEEEAGMGMGMGAASGTSLINNPCSSPSPSPSFHSPLPLFFSCCSPMIRGRAVSSMALPLPLVSSAGSELHRVDDTIKCMSVRKSL